MRFSKKRTKEIMKNTNLVKKNLRLKKELDEILERDELYTPTSHNKQSAEGNRREDLIGEWLDERNIAYFTEEDLRAGTVEGKLLISYSKSQLIGTVTNIIGLNQKQVLVMSIYIAKIIVGRSPNMLNYMVKEFLSIGMVI